MTAPAVSVLMPVFNGEHHIREAIESILGQTYSDFELLVVDDHSTDSTGEIVREYCERDARVRATRNQEAKGTVGALNTGLGLARGEYLARMDADDISLPTRLEKQHAFLEQHDDISVCGTNMELFGAQQFVWRLPQDHEAIRAGLIFTVLIAHATVMIRRSALEEYHYRYDPDYEYAEDYELWSRLSERYRFANLPDVLYRYRKYDSDRGSLREETRSRSAQRVRLRLLGALGIVPSPAESELHQQIGDYCYRPTKDLVRRANRWLDKILEANERSRVFDQQALRIHVEERRAEIQGATPIQANESRIPALDGLRGIAILLVLFLHFGQFGHGLPAPTVLVDKVFIHAARTGWMGVDLFFVLSGFLITGILYDTKGSPGYFRQFYARRVLRIFPLYYAALALFLIILPAMRPEHWVLRDLTADSAWYWTYLYNVKVAIAGFRPTSALGHFWSLAVEEQFYLVWPLVVLWLGRKHLLVTCVVAVLGALVFRLVSSSTGYVVLPDVLTPARMDALAVGAFIAIIARSPNGLRVMRRWAVPVAVAAALPLAVLLRYNVALATVSHTLVALLFGAVLVLALTVSPVTALGTAVASPILRFFGRYSYALYVFHHPLLWFKPAFSLAFVPTVFGSQVPAYLLWLVISIGVSVAIALVSWHLLEKQFLKMKTLFPYERPLGHPQSARSAW